MVAAELVDKGDRTKMRLHLRKLEPTEHMWYVNFILSDEPSSRTFVQTIQTLRKVSGDPSSLFNT